jgi:hypothetical protein
VHVCSQRRWGYRDPESQAFIESWFRKLKERAVRRFVIPPLVTINALLSAVGVSR